MVALALGSPSKKASFIHRVSAKSIIATVASPTRELRAHSVKRLCRFQQSCSVATPTLRLSRKVGPSLCKAAAPNFSRRCLARSAWSAGSGAQPATAEAPRDDLDRWAAGFLATRGRILVALRCRDVAREELGKPLAEEAVGVQGVLGSIASGGRAKRSASRGAVGGVVLRRHPPQNGVYECGQRKSRPLPADGKHGRCARPPFGQSQDHCHRVRQDQMPSAEVLERACEMLQSSHRSAGFQNHLRLGALPL